MLIEEILIIKNGSESYGISTQEINQILRVPALMSLPLRPTGTRGLCAIEGNIVTVVDLSVLLDMGEVNYDAQESRVLSFGSKHSSNALLVSEVYNTVEINQENIEYFCRENDPVIAIYKHRNSLVQLLSLDILFSKIQKMQKEEQDIKSGKVKSSIVKDEDTNRFLIFSMNEEAFALSIDFLVEIIATGMDYTEIAGSSKDVVGLITLRDELILVVDLRVYYGFERVKSDKNRILIASCEGKKIGLLVDSVEDIRNVSAKDIEYLGDSFEKNKILGVIHDDKHLVSFFGEKVLKSLFSQHELFVDSQKTTKEAGESANAFTEVIVFELLGKEYAFEAEHVAEIIDFVPTTTVALSDELIDGIINIRGQIVAIVSLHKKLGIESKKYQNSKIIICGINETRVGFIVDKISDILSVKATDIKEQDEVLFPSVLHLRGGERLVLLIDVNSIVSKKGV